MVAGTGRDGVHVPQRETSCAAAPLTGDRARVGCVRLQARYIETNPEMRTHYDFSETRRNPYAKRLKKQVTISEESCLTPRSTSGPQPGRLTRGNLRGEPAAHRDASPARFIRVPLRPRVSASTVGRNL